MDRDVETVADFWHRLDAGRLDAALALVGEHGAWQPLAGGQELGVERRGAHIVVRGVIRYSGRGRFMESQGHWVHRVRDGAVVECRGVATACDADAVVAA